MKTPIASTPNESEILEQLQNAVTKAQIAKRKEIMRRASNRSKTANTLRLETPKILSSLRNYSPQQKKSGGLETSELQNATVEWDFYADLGKLATKRPELFFQRCQKSGRKLQDIPFNSLLPLMQIGGIEKALLFLDQTQLNHVAPEWLVTDGPSLKKLQSTYPKEFFIYAASKIFHSQNINLSNGENISIAKFQRRNAKPQAVTVIKQAVEIRTLPFHVRQSQFIELCQAHDNMADWNFPAILDQVNETMRRVFALVDPAHLFRFEELQAFKFLSITSCKITLCAFESQLKELLMVLTQRAIDKRIKTQSDKEVRVADVLEIAVKYKGKMAFRNQKSKPQKYIDPAIQLMLADFLSIECATQNEVIGEFTITPKPVDLITSTSPKANSKDSSIHGLLDYTKLKPAINKPKSALAKLLKKAVK